MFPLRKILFPICLCCGLLMGCMREDLDDCVEQMNLVVHFHMYDGQENDIFANEISVVYLMLFNEEQRYYTHVMVDGDRIVRDRRAELSVDPGTYHITAWANITENSSFSDLTTYSTPSSSILMFATDRQADRIHYAPRKEIGRTRSDDDDPEDEEDPSTTLPPPVTVPASGVKEHDMEFISAYRCVRVWVQGLDDLSGAELPLPRTEITKLPLGYDFLLTETPQRTSYSVIAEPTETSLGPMSLSVLYTPQFEVTETIDINLLSYPANERLYTLNLGNFLSMQGEMPQPHEDIDILLEFMQDGTVKVRLINWSVIGVDPV